MCLREQEFQPLVLEFQDRHFGDQAIIHPLDPHVPLTQSFQAAQQFAHFSRISVSVKDKECQL